jgi:hypothetical protein
MSTSKDGKIRSISDLPDLATVEEVAQALRISRTLGYQLARRWLDTDGREGIPVIRLGGVLRTPRLALERFLGIAAQEAS